MRRSERLCPRMFFCRSGRWSVFGAFRCSGDVTREQSGWNRRRGWLRHVRSVVPSRGQASVRERERTYASIDWPGWRGSMRRLSTARLLQLGAELSERDRELTQTVGELRLASHDQLARLLAAPGSAASVASQARLARRTL